MSQPAVSNAIRLIETQIGFPLFERLNSRLYPTEAARQLQKESEPLFTLHAALERRVEDMRTDKVTRLWMLSTPPLGHGIIPEALRRFLRRHTRLRMFFNVRELNEVVKGIESGDADLGFGLGLGSEPTLQVERLFEGRMVCVCPLGHPLTRLAVVTPADLRRHSFVALDAATRMGSAVRDAFIATGQPPDFPFPFTSATPPATLCWRELARRWSIRSPPAAAGGSKLPCSPSNRRSFPSLMPSGRVSVRLPGPHSSSCRTSVRYCTKASQIWPPKERSPRRADQAIGRSRL